MGKRFRGPHPALPRGGGINASGRSATATQAAKQREDPNHGKGEAEDDQTDWDKPLMALLAPDGAVRDHEEQPKERCRQDANERTTDPQRDLNDRFHRVVTFLSSRCLDVDHQSGWITELEGANAG